MVFWRISLFVEDFYGVFDFLRVVDVVFLEMLVIWKDILNVFVIIFLLVLFYIYLKYYYKIVKSLK